MSTHPQPLRIECPDVTSFCTSRTQNSALWLRNTPQLEEHILGYLAKYQQKYQVTLYAGTFVGNHYHLVAHFPHSNRAQFMRDLNARMAELVRLHVKEFRGGSLFGRRYAEQALILPQDIEKQFFYCALQPVSSGLVPTISQYPSYNSFSDATSAIVRQYKVFDKATYNARKRYNPHLRKVDFITEYPLIFTRLPGYEQLSQQEYKKQMLHKLEKERVQIVEKRHAQGLGFLGLEALLNTAPGTYPTHTKTSSRTSFRPLVLTSCPQARAHYLSFYFAIKQEHLRCSALYREGDDAVGFPPGTYRPPRFDITPARFG